ncbi:CYTH domain-containing protein [Flavobacterium agrisoli]|uniref:CYTH domain-containing protein n=1 Tax=Flavobacterium agrisoli TaxID=2793066 RepID=A0A934UIK9_9FLAO|nr:CYTH domain-containing protein [Flavobacterium agrisoli]MBK0368490.1 CYTH domain-containing protein [Flavobacterium agrisoli]
MIEIERKFKVLNNDYKAQAFAQNRIAQGYLSSDVARTVRIRIKGEKGYITIKGIGNESGLSRFEWEKEIPLNEAQQLLAICEKGVIDKIRYEIQSGNHVFEVDEFFEENEGLVIAEVELAFEAELFEKPNWLGEEVTNDPKYYNAYLSKNPFKNWKNDN